MFAILASKPTWGHTWVSNVTGFMRVCFALGAHDKTYYLNTTQEKRSRKNSVYT